MQISGQQKAQIESLRRWVISELTVLAEAFGETVSEQRLAINAADLLDIPQETLREVFIRSRRELKWYPKVAELREMALGKPQDNLEAGASKAWDDVQKFLRKWGCNPLPVWSHGKEIYPPAFDERTERAMRCVGGLKAIEYADEKTFGFMKRDFMTEWIRFDAAERQPSALLPSKEIKQLAEATDMEKAVEVALEVKALRPPMTDAEIEARRKELAHQAKVMMQG